MLGVFWCTSSLCDSGAPMATVGHNPLNPNLTGPIQETVTKKFKWSAPSNRLCFEVSQFLLGEDLRQLDLE